MEGPDTNRPTRQIPKNISAKSGIGGPLEGLDTDRATRQIPMNDYQPKSSRNWETIGGPRYSHACKTNTDSHGLINKPKE